MSTVTMGNDEFILYIRKNYDCKTTNDKLGKEIWQWISANDPLAEQVTADLPCLWEKEGMSVDSCRLPKTAAQFKFDRRLLCRLYDYLDELGRM